MALFDELKKKYKQTLTAGKQGLSNVLDRTDLDERAVNSFVRPIQQTFSSNNRRLLGESLSPQNRQAITNNITSAYQDWKKKPSNQIVKQASTPQGQQDLSQTLRQNSGYFGDIGEALNAPAQFVTNRYLAPAAQALYPQDNKKSYYYNKLASPGLMNKGEGLLGMAGGTLAMIPDPIGDVAMPAWDFLKGVNKSENRGAGFGANLKSGIQSLTGENYVGVGDTVFQEGTMGADALNLAELPALLFAGGLKGKKFDVADADMVNMKRASKWIQDWDKLSETQAAPRWMTIMETAQEQIPEVLKTREMQRLEKADKAAWLKQIGRFLDTKIDMVENPKKYSKFGLSTQALKTDAQPTKGDMGSLEKAVVDRYGLTNNPKEAAFITSDGNYVKTSGGDMDSHLSMVGGYGTEAYLKETGSIRMTDTDNALYIQTATPLNKYQEMAIFKATTDNPKKTIVVDYTPEPQDQGGRVMGEFGIKSGEFDSIDKVKSFIKRQHQDYLKYADSIAPKGEALTPAELKEFNELGRLPQGQLVQDYAKEQRYNLLREKYNNQAKDNFQSLPQPTKGGTTLNDLQKSGLVSGFAGSNKKVTPVKQIADEGLDLVRQAIYSGDEGAAKAIYNTIDGKKPPFKSLVNEVTSLQDSEIKSVKNVSSNQFGEYEDVVKKFKTLLKRSGESVNEAGVLNREHITMNKFGISSDEVAGALGMSEVKFMEQITKDLDMAGKGTATKQQLARLDKNMAKVKNLVTKLGLDDEFYKINTDQIGRRLGVSAAPGGEMSPKTLRKVKTRSESKAKADFQQWQRAVLEQSGGSRTTRQAVDVIAKNIEQNTSGGGDLTNTKDISNLSKGFNTVYRNFQRVFGDKYPQVKARVLDPFDKSKGQHISDLEREAGTLYSDVVQGLGIKKGSKESAAVQLYGEGKKSYADLVSEFGKQTADNIVQADKWFRSQYDRLLTEVNQVRGRIYPNNPDKLIPKRNDYYRHFREMREGFGALLNIFDSPGNIAPGLESISESTKPKSKWLSFAQKRLGDKTDVDAVGGFLDYIRSSSYAKNIDPHIQVFRGLRDDLVKATSNVNDPNYGKVNNFINFLDKYANDLSGKTNQADRVFQEIVPGGRRAFAAINWLNNRVKANVILGNVSSSLAQVLNLPQGVASAGRYNAPGLGRTMIEMFSDNKTIAKSDFIKERYSGDVFNKFDTGMLSNTKKFAVWMTGALDEVATKYMWNAHYEKALREGLGNPVKYADDVTRSLVGGRGIGEVPLMQKARTFQMIAPFQLEVGNFWYVMKDMVDKKQFGKLATLFVMTHVMNKGLEAIRGSGGAFDPIQAMIDMYDISQDDEDNKSVRMVGRGAGEVLSNVPLGQSVAAAYPEYGFKVGDSQLPTREALFGDADPTRFGSGLLAMKGLQDPLYKVLPPFGGNQLKKTITGAQAYNQGYSETKTGKVRFPIDKNPVNLVKSAAFGEYSTNDARKYFDSDSSPLGDNQSQTFKKLLMSSPGKALDYYNSIAGRSGGDGAKDISMATMQVYANEGNKLPSETKMLGVLYDKAKGVVDGYEEDKLLIENDPTLDYDEKVDRLAELDAKNQGWGAIVNRIEQERPEQVLTLEVNQHVSGGGKTTEERAEWAYKKIFEMPKEDRSKFVEKLLNEKVLTKSVVEQIKDEYGLLIPLYSEGGKIKQYSTGGSKSKKPPKDLFKAVKVSIPKAKRVTPTTRRKLTRVQPRNLQLKAKQVVQI